MSTPATPGQATSAPPAGRLWLIPTPLQQPDESRPWLLEADRQQVATLTDFLVETPKVARRWLGQLGMQHPIQALNLRALPQRPAAAPARLDPHDWLAPLLQGRDMGLLSDAGCPGVADPGAALIAAAHRMNLPVMPLVGPSSLLLGLMASGLNGQRFAFRGYLPTAADARAQHIIQLAQRARQHQETQLLIETPYRNQAMAEALINHLPAGAQLCIAIDLTGPAQSIQTRAVSDWRRRPPTLPTRRPALFLFLA